MQRLYNLDQNLRAHIHTIALRIQPGDIAEQLEPLQLDSRQHCPLRLHHLILTLDVPRIESSDGTRRRIEHEAIVFRTIYDLVNVDKVTVNNIFHRDQSMFRQEMPGQHWTILEFEEDSDELNDDR